VSARRLLSLLLAAALAGACTAGGSGSDGGADPALVPEPLTYAAVGASETAGVGTSDPIENAWPRILWRTLPTGSALYDFGVGGSTTHQALLEQVNAAAAVEPDVATVWLNVNDLLHGVSPRRYGRELRVVVHDLRRDGRTTVLVANTPRLDTLPAYRACRAPSGRFVDPLGRVVECDVAFALRVPPPEAVRAAVDAYNRQIERVVATEGAILVDLHALGDVPTAHPEWVSEDGFHPSDSGAEAIAAAFERALENAGS
jgi:lysophospholipase L1-like esterase